MIMLPTRDRGQSFCFVLFVFSVPSVFFVFSVFFVLSVIFVPSVISLALSTPTKNKEPHQYIRRGSFQLTDTK